MIQEQNTFAGFPAGCLTDGDAADVVIIGIPYGVPYQADEISPCYHAPDAIRAASNRYPEDVISWDFDLHSTLLNDSAISVVDYGNLEGDTDDPGGNLVRGRDAVRTILKKDALPIVLGGDDSIPLMAFEAYEEMHNINILQIDAHIDWRDEVGGQKKGFSSTMRRASELNCVDRIIQVGARGTGTARKQELDAAIEYGSLIISGYDLHKNGVGQILDSLPSDKPCYLTIDCDGLDPSIMPAVMSPIAGGVGYYQILDLIRGIHKKAGLAGLNVVEFVPHKDINSIGAVTAMRIIWNFIGEIAKQGKNPIT